MRKFIVLLSLVFCYFNSVSQSEIDEINILLINKRYNEALELTKKLNFEFPNNASYYYQQALIYNLLYKYPQAINSIKKAIELDSLNMDYLAEYGFMLQKIDMDIKSQEIFEKVIEKDPFNLNVGISLSNTYLKQKRNEQAEKILMNLYLKDSLNGFIARNIGLCSYKQGNSAKTIKWLLRAIQLDSTDIKAYKLLFSVYAAKEEFDLAFRTIDKAISIDPQNKYLYILAGDLHVIRNHNFRAIPEYLRAFEVDSSDEELPAKLGLSYYKIQNYEKAKYYLLIADKRQMNLDVCKHLGYIYKAIDYDSSTMFFNKALDILRPDNNSIFEIYVKIAENHIQLKNYQHTIHWYERALKLELTGIWSMSLKNKVLIDLAFVYADKMNDKMKAIEYLGKVTDDSIFVLNEKDYYSYAQQQITKLKEELFFEGKL